MPPLPARFAALPAEARGAVLLILAMALFAAMDAVAKGLMTRHSPLQVIWARYLGQALIVVLLLAPRLRTVARTRYPGVQVVRSALLFGSTVCGFVAFSVMPLAEVTAIFEVSPLMITALAALVLGERVGPRRWAAVAVGFVGALVIVRPGTAAFQPAALLPVLGAACFASYSIATRFLGREEDRMTTLLYSAALGAAAASLAVPFHWTTPSAADAGLMLALAALGTLGQFLLIVAFNAAPASAIAPFTYTGLLFATLWGLIFFAEVPDGWTLAGSALIVGSGVYVWGRTQARAAAA